MNSTTLRGIFPGPKPVHRRNFMKENIKQLKALSDIQQERKSASVVSAPLSKYKAIASKISAVSAARYRRGRSSAPQVRHISQGVQTDRSENKNPHYSPGRKFKYPTPQATPQKSQRDKGAASHREASPLHKGIQRLVLSDDAKDFVAANMRNLKPKAGPDPRPDPIQPPPGYQKGVVPRYLKEKRDERSVGSPGRGEGEAGTGLVLLPDDERKEYLRVARENYAALIKELNAMPVRNDTLRRRKRKIEIEDELRRLDEVIKIFQKPKVFVKADA